MEAKQWERVEELFHAAVELEPANRAGYLSHECSDDEVLRKEVESLIAASEEVPTFIGSPALSLGMRVLSSITEFMPGQTIGHYKIIRLLGKGGMGKVYLAQDCMLERQVALKFVVGGLGNEDQLMKEARAIAKIDNPNICGVHGLEKIGEQSFIVMPYVEGETLASRLLREPPSLDHALDFAEQTVSALSAAHLHGVIHRDVKPQNIVVTPEGQIKVLDFGLAKFVLRSLGIGKPGVGIDETTQVGIVIGTIAYMSPEQIRGDKLDARSDVFSFGIVLYEMLGGRNPFVRDTNEETLVAIQEEEPPWLAGVPENLASIVRRCLAKDRTERFETTTDLLAAIRAVGEQRRLGYWQAFRRHRHFSKFAVAALAFLICVIAASGFVYSRLSKEHTLAVVPITNLSADPNLDYLTSGLSRNLYEKFSYLPRFKVSLPTAVPSNQTEDLVRAGRELNVESVLYGELLKQDDSLLLRVRVLNTADGKLSFNHTFSVDPTNMFGLQDDVTRGVTAALGVWLIGDERKLLTKRQTDNQQALEAYTRGRHYWGLKRDRENLQTAIRFFGQAIDLDPAFAKAYTGRADCYVLMSNVLYGPLSTKDAMDRARADARQALEIDPSLPEAHTSMGTIRFRYDWDWPEAEKEFELAIDLNPEYAPAHFWYSNLLAVMGRFDESIKEGEKARSLDPYSPTSAMNYGRALYYARRYDESERFFRKMLEENPEYPQVLHMMAYVLLQQGEIDEAITMLEKLYSKSPYHAAAALGYAYGKAGKYDDARRMLHFLEQSPDPLPPHERAIVLIGMGETDDAFKLLEMSYQDRFAGLIFLRTDPLYDSLRADRRNAALAQRIGLDY
ncbi:MAG TPA: protein kinase [Pyrinomonadaceae bacterium]|nr:protein kinase [Pyrinomonadaceae bacterium]